MGYPLPQPRAFFAWRIAENYSENTSENYSEKGKEQFVLPDFSWSEAPSPLLSEFLAFLQKWSRLTRNFPFVQQIFLANSLSFNGLKADSDLDLFVITKKGRIRTARLMMSLMMLFFGIKRTANAERKRFCLSFFVDEEHSELEKLLLHEQDVYLPYWIAHLVPWYQEQRSEAVFQKNAWISRFLPHFQAQQMISLGVQVQTGKGGWKSFWELVLGGRIGTVVEKWIKRLWLPRMESLKKKNPELHQGILIEEGILKFHYDQRQKYSDLFFS
ncbi:MAG: hypothetical protein DLD55_05655 [candidate division SR1 bacterium]|nr:MAG: hypothetical protein DLD55_05655 [candidate division SR1 bacterium]